VQVVEKFSAPGFSQNKSEKKFLHRLAQKYPMTSPCPVKISHAGQKHPIVFTFDGAEDIPRAQKSVSGWYRARMLRLYVGHAPQYFWQISWFPGVASTVAMPEFTMKG
jgi:hypothetical protein